MTVERRNPAKPGEVRLVECPYCGDDLTEGHPARHLSECEAFRAAWGHDARSAPGQN